MGADMSEREMIRAAGEYAEELYQAGKSVEAVQAALESRSLSTTDACEIAYRIFRLRAGRISKQTANREAGQTKMAIGALLSVGGIIVTVGSYLTAGSGGSFVFAWGAILFGALLFLWGWEQTRERV